MYGEIRTAGKKVKQAKSTSFLKLQLPSRSDIPLKCLSSHRLNLFNCACVYLIHYSCGLAIRILLFFTGAIVYENTLMEDGSLLDIMLCVMYEFPIFFPILNHILSC